jgi:hypothetical protein
MKPVTSMIGIAVIALAFAAQARSYVAIGGTGNWWNSRAYVSLGNWQGGQPSIEGAARAINVADRPYVSGKRPAEVELLVDALRRKQPRTIGESTERAYESIVRNSMRDPVKRSHFRGMLAEARYVYENPEWGYVRSPTASQHDIYRWQAGRKSPYTAQIKTHGSADPTAYARKMRVDFRSDLFLVPDEHVDGIRNYWRAQATELEGRGLRYVATEARRQLNRVQGLKFTNAQLDDDLTSASRYILLKQGRTYVSLGAGRGLVLNSVGRELFRTGPIARPPVLGSATHVAGLSAERLRTRSLSSVGSRGPRLAWRGVAGVGVALVVLDTSWSIYSLGGVTAALHSPYFYTRLVGSVSGTALGLWVGTEVAGYVTASAVPMAGGWAPVVGGTAGFIAGAIAAAGGYIGGESVARTLGEAVNPEAFRAAERKSIESARGDIASRLADARVMPLSPVGSNP